MAQYHDFHGNIRNLAELNTWTRQRHEAALEPDLPIIDAHHHAMESNFPADKQSCGYGVLWNALKRITVDCTAAEKSALYRDTAARVYQLQV